MKKEDIKWHLKEYEIYSKRKTTINHAFASAISVADKYDGDKIKNALNILGQDPNEDLKCAYCNNPAETWDHIKAIVKDGEFSGYGHQISNLIPCCKNCNSKKGNKEWKAFLSKNELDTADRIQKIESYISQDSFSIKDILNEKCKSELEELNRIKEEIFELMKQGDKQAAIIRNKVREIKSNGK